MERDKLVRMLIGVLREGNLHLATECPRCDDRRCDACNSMSWSSEALHAFAIWERDGDSVVEGLLDAVLELHRYTSAHAAECETCTDLEAATSEAQFRYLSWFQQRQ